MPKQEQIARMHEIIDRAWSDHLKTISGRILRPADVAVEQQLHRMEDHLQAWEAIFKN
jgi:hypothetical protein